MPRVRPSVFIFRPTLLFSHGIPRRQRGIHFSFYAGLLVSPAGGYQSRGVGVGGQLNSHDCRKYRRMFDTASATITPRQWVMAALAFLLLAVVFYVYAYNSGYGYDACEYWRIGRSLLDGVRISTFILSKGWAMYAATGMALAVLPANHAWVSLIVVVWFVAAVSATWWVGHKLFGPAAGAVSALLVAASGFFMEMNFLEPEIPD